MAEKALSTVTVPAITTLAIASVDTGTMEKMREASPEGFTMLNLDRISFPTADSLTFNVPTEEGPDPRRYIDAIIIHHHAARQRYSGAYDPTQPTPPLCSSYDGISGSGTPGGVCARCVYNQMGTDAECRPYVWLYLLFADSVFPTFLSLPRTSLSRKLANGVSKYFVTLAKGGKDRVKGGLWPWEVITRIGLADRQRGVGKVATFTEGPRLASGLADLVKAYALDFRKSLTFPTGNGAREDEEHEHTLQSIDPTLEPPDSYDDDI